MSENAEKRVRLFFPELSDAERWYFMGPIIAVSKAAFEAHQKAARERANLAPMPIRYWDRYILHAYVGDELATSALYPALRDAEHLDRYNALDLIQRAAYDAHVDAAHRFGVEPMALYHWARHIRWGIINIVHHCQNWAMD